MPKTTTNVTTPTSGLEGCHALTVALRPESDGAEVLLEPGAVAAPSGTRPIE